MSFSISVHECFYFGMMLKWSLLLKQGVSVVHILLWLAVLHTAFGPCKYVSKMVQVFWGNFWLHQGLKEAFLPWHVMVL